MNWNLPLATILSVLVFSIPAAAQEGHTTLATCLSIAHRNNIAINQAQRSLNARQYQVKAENATYYPKVDLLAGYNYLSKPLEVNLEQVRGGIINGSSAQVTNGANEVFKQITGNDLPQNVQDNINKVSKDILGAFYPNYNPALAQQSYFTSSLILRQPIYLGGKLAVARDVAHAELRSGEANIELVGKELDYAVATNYIRVLYSNTLMRAQDRIILAMERYERMAESLVRNEIIPPYQKNWASVAVIHARTRKNNQELDKMNAMVELKRLLQIPQDSNLVITDTLRYAVTEVEQPQADFWRSSPTYKAIETKTALAQSTVKASKSLQLPNIFAIANVQLYQHDLPITIPPWLVGVELQWNLFSGFANTRRVKASQEFLAAAKLANANTQQIIEAGAQVSRNQVMMLQKDIAALDAAWKQAMVTTKQISERLENQMSSVKDVNDALLVEEEIGKAYNTAVLGYWIALATYYNILGTPQQIVSYIP
ncbi:outer membrane protein TolC [Chitinophaga skermanii]|uniref:Outer membrane protein TolC n=1 Tax=Chitinophaga skermanii TaxID=331697 RepID=A0A327QUY0_9BACT|nr:TolC family protein [Chitinophaga skermanii]RAJ08419.1 outer membrane protein TolC [Chitinophaga skermanii]